MSHDDYLKIGSHVKSEGARSIRNKHLETEDHQIISEVDEPNQDDSLSDVNEMDDKTIEKMANQHVKRSMLRDEGKSKDSFTNNSTLLSNNPAGDALMMERNSHFKNAINRYPAIAITMSLELFVAFIIQNFIATLTNNDLLISFMPIISAISGNVGLQASSINVRALALGIIKPTDVFKALKKAFSVAFFLGFMSGFILGIIGGIWQGVKLYQDDHEGNYVTNGLLFGGVLFFCQWLSAISAGMFGAWSPLLFKRFKMDPGNIAGPLETAFQDIVGTVAICSIASAIL